MPEEAEIEALVQSAVLAPQRLKQRIAERPHSFLFYPAGLYDWQPLRHLSDLVDTIVYCDLTINYETFPQGVEGLRAIGVRGIPAPKEICINGELGLGLDDKPWLEKYLSPAYKEQYLRATNIVQQCGGPWGRELTLHINRKEMLVYCFRAEAFRCYTALFTERNVAPKVVCLKNPHGLQRHLDLDCWSAPLGRAVADSPQPELLITDRPRRPECDWPWRREWRDFPEWQATAYWRQHPVTYPFLLPNM